MEILSIGGDREDIWVDIRLTLSDLQDIHETHMNKGIHNFFASQVETTLEELEEAKPDGYTGGVY